MFYADIGKAPCVWGAFAFAQVFAKLNAAKPQFIPKEIHVRSTIHIAEQ